VSEFLPLSVDVSLSQGVTIVWNDGREDRFSIASLRAACPCATCADLHHTGDRSTAVPPPEAKANPLPMFKPTGASLLAVHPVGRYALQFEFSDNHKTGIFTWEYLRELGGR
jgi:DUF971 family protein